MIRRHFLASALLAAQPAPAFTSLFDGQSLHGWHVVDGPESSFYVEDGAIVVSEAANSPTWLRSAKQYENFELQFEFFVKGWIDSGLLLHAPLHGNAQDAGFCVKLFHKNESPKPEGMGSIFPVVAPKGNNVKSKGEWNQIRVRFDWPKLQVWTNGEQIQDVNVETVPELAHRLRHGFIGFQSLSYPIRFRNIAVRELPGSTPWRTLYGKAADLSANWQVEEGKAKWTPIGDILRADGLGHLATKERFQDFALETYIRAALHSNGGVLFRAEGSGQKAHYEIQLHDVEGAVYPTGSLYGLKRARFPHIAPEAWYLFQLFVKGPSVTVRINGETVTEYNTLDRTGDGHILLQAHQAGRWIEYKDIRVRAL
ncbi:MAG TPA: DUF1080 domain-containing protein [Bryobacteraceae bacterium]|nr:DUF1080 domain-containing protein [Bryobacteraceae bacterium]